MLTSDAFHFETPDGIRIFVDHWKSPKPSGAGRILFIVHGYGEHGGRYSHVADALSDLFDGFYAVDLRGHGRSGGTRGHAPSFDTILDDVKAAIAEVKKREPGKRLFLLAHSFGGMLMINQLSLEKKSDFELAIISAPLLEVAMPLSKALVGIAGILNKTLYKIQLGSEINPMHLSHDPVATEAYMRDHLVHSKITPRMYFSMLDGMARARAFAGPLPCPTLFLAGGDDRIVSTPAIREFFSHLKMRDKEYKEYPGFYHEVLNELGRAQVIGDIREWLTRQWSKGAS